MSRIPSALSALQSRRDGAFMPFLVIGDPNLETCLEITKSLIQSGADILEFGFPFSDPPADGPIIQASSKRSLASGTRVEDAFHFLENVRSLFDGPVVLLLYYNLILRQGVEAFYARARSVGVDGILVADVPLEESGRIIQAAQANEIDPIFIAASSSDKSRLQQIARHGSGFVYGVTRIGITGEQSRISTTLSDTIKNIQHHTGLPCLAGFGISSPAHVLDVMQAGAEGAICGSAIIRRIEENLSDPPALIRGIHQFANEMKQATVGNWKCHIPEGA